MLVVRLALFGASLGGPVEGAPSKVKSKSLEVKSNSV